jgi:hypothetical protein
MTDNSPAPVNRTADASTELADEATLDAKVSATHPSRFRRTWTGAAVDVSVALATVQTARTALEAADASATLRATDMSVLKADVSTLAADVSTLKSEL